MGLRELRESTDALAIGAVCSGMAQIHCNKRNSSGKLETVNAVALQCVAPPPQCAATLHGVPILDLNYKASIYQNGVKKALSDWLSATVAKRN